ncbi:chordin-like isoform X1 [Tachypleus tridentatus]|uniref:chordin-like isoform X1 n=1 Tax=Tachypleus tridentatus TaxID=6853 RepID=UPI003FCF95C8
MASWTRTLVWRLLVTAVFSRTVAADSGGLKSPLKEADAHRQISRQTHCQFGNNSYEIEERWRPDLGPPFGVFYCVHCECVAVQRKRRIVARTKCKNIKNSCPKLTCDEPVFLPERCCKSCPGEDYLALEEHLANQKLGEEDDDRKMKEFTVLLTGRGVSPMVPTESVARGYFTYVKRKLHYTIHYVGSETPTFLRFTDSDGKILEEHEINQINHYGNGLKMCGVWRMIPKVYRRKLMKGKLHLTLATEHYPEGLVAGKFVRSKELKVNEAIEHQGAALIQNFPDDLEEIVKIPGLPLIEVFSAVLLPNVLLSPETAGGGGVAVVSLSQGNVLLTIDFNGILDSKDSRHVSFIVRLKTPDDQIQAVTMVNLQKVYPDLNTVDVKFDVTSAQELLLSQNGLFLEISSEDGTRALSGPILPKTTCNVFQTILTTGQSADAQKEKRPLSTGFGVLVIQANGSISFKIRTARLTGQVIKISLETRNPTNQGTTTLTETTQMLSTGQWINGTFRKATARDLETLLIGDLYLHVQTMKGEENLRGHVRQRLYTEAFTNEVPLLLVGNNTAAGQVWLSVDKHCQLHYEVFVSGLHASDDDVDGRRQRHLVEVQEVHLNRHRKPDLHVLRKFGGEEVGDVFEGLGTRTLIHLEFGQSAFLITTKTTGVGKKVDLEGRITNLHLPDSCFPQTDQLRSGKNVRMLKDSFNKIYPEPTHKCYYEGEVIEDGLQWKAQHETCTMCSCQMGRVHCDTIVCPKLTCDRPLTLKGECCPVCSEVNNNTAIEKKPRGCFFEGDKKFHLAGTRWHPYLPPFGFSRCAVCTCDEVTLQVECRKINCPLLTCGHNDVFREHPHDCCKKCRTQVRIKSYETHQHNYHPGDEAISIVNQEEINKDILAAGGCLFGDVIHPNGDFWHPTVQPFGEMKCVTCSCKDGKQKCERERCPKFSCVVKIEEENECCPRCIDSSEIRSKGRQIRMAGKTKKRIRWESSSKHH